MREYDVKVCGEECGRMTLMGTSEPLWWIKTTSCGWHLGDAGDVIHCPFCGTRVGIDERGPWREQMVPRAALEWVVNIAGGDFNDCPIAGNGDFEDLPENWCQMCVVRDPEGALYEECKCDRNKECRVEECWIAAALKAAEEDSDAATAQDC